MAGKEMQAIISGQCYLALDVIIKGRNFMQATTLNQYQKHVVDLMANVDENQQMEISNLLAHYFAQKAFDAADELWDSGLIGEETIDEWKSEHMRTPYHE